MNNSLPSSDTIKSSLTITILVTAMLLPVIVIAWCAKWIYNRSAR